MYYRCFEADANLQPRISPAFNPPARLVRFYVRMRPALDARQCGDDRRDLTEADVRTVNPADQ